MPLFVKASSPADSIIVGMTGTDGHTYEACEISMAITDRVEAVGTVAAAPAFTTLSVTSIAETLTDTEVTGSLSGTAGAVTITYL